MRRSIVRSEEEIDKHCEQIKKIKQNKFQDFKIENFKFSKVERENISYFEKIEDFDDEQVSKKLLLQKIRQN